MPSGLQHACLEQFCIASGSANASGAGALAELRGTGGHIRVEQVNARSGDVPVLHDLALGRYVQEPDATLASAYQATLATAQHEQRLELLCAVQTDPDLKALYFDIVAGIENISALYVPKLLALL